MRRTLTLLLICVLVPSVTAGEQHPEATVVVADIGPGVNPYHRVFRRPGWTQPPSVRIPGFPSGFEVLPLTLGDNYAASRASDEPLWAAYRPGVLYWVPGTNLLLHTMRIPVQAPLPDGNAETYHGTGSAGAIAMTCRDCFILVVHDGESLDGMPAQRIADEMPWVDFVVSTNNPGSIETTVDSFVTQPYTAATKALWESGRLFVAASGNRPVTGADTGVTANRNLPPWVVPVGGAHGACSASELSAGKPAEFVGDFAWSGPAVQTVDGRIPLFGTSFAAPQVAGALGATLSRLRSAVGDTRSPGLLWAGTPRPGTFLDDGALTAEEIRRALRHSARYFRPQDYALDCAARYPVDTLPVPASVTPWIEMGWGYADAMTAATAADVILGLAPVSAREPAAAAYLTAFDAARGAAFG